MNNNQNENEWNNDNNWSFFYFSKKDSRWIVPKRKHIGWTFNLGHTKGGLIFLACLILPFLITLASIILATIFSNNGFFSSQC